MLMRWPGWKSAWKHVKNAWEASNGATLEIAPGCMQANDYHDIMCGWHSGYRPCCISFFLIWKRLPYRFIMFIHHLTILDGFSYIPCPLCFITNQRHLKPITCKCCPCKKTHHKHCKNRQT